MTATANPLINPITAPAKSAVKSAIIKLCPFEIILIIIVPPRAAIFPTDISKFPEIITNVIPVAITPIIDDCLNRLSILFLVRKLGVAKLIIVHKTKKPIIIP